MVTSSARRTPTTAPSSTALVALPSLAAVLRAGVPGITGAASSLPVEAVSAPAAASTPALAAAGGGEGLGWRWRGAGAAEGAEAEGAETGRLGAGRAGARAASGPSGSQAEARATQAVEATADAST